MRSVTEFWSATLFKGIKAKEALAAEGKSAEEIQTSLGETFKMEGDKLKYFIAAIDVAAQNQDKLSRVLVVSLNEGEEAPSKAVKVEEMHYVPDFQVAARAVNTKKFDPKSVQQNKKTTKTKTSPWGLTPEEKAAKKGGGVAKG